jgi:hypothetical protein
MALFFINGILIFIFGIRTLDENRIDKLFHVFGGMIISISIAGFLWHLMVREIIVLQDENVFCLLVFGFLCFLVISWEVFEYVFIPIFQENPYSDAIIDMICGLIGGLFTIIFVLRRAALGSS